MGYKNKMSTFVVTGATGFLGGRLVEILRSKNFSVIALGRNEIAGKRLSDLGALFVQASLTDEAKLSEVIPMGCIVVHAAALSSAWGKYEDFYESNVRGTEVLAKVARQKKASRFVHISTPSIYVSRGSRFDIRETDSLPQASINSYAKTKLLGERAIDREVKDGLQGICLRPQGIFGPKDPSILPRLIRVAQKGFIPVIGSENVQIDLTHVDNVCEAILCAANANPVHIGKKYNVTNGAPIDQLTTLTSILTRLGYPVREKKISLFTAEKIALALEWSYRVLKLSGEPLLTRYSVYTLAFSRTLNIDAIRADLNYSPRVTMEEGIEGYVKWYKQSAS
jgi:nucleoside-diphosphate-sugar epimerase